jgi:hypothetical protein
MDAGISVGRQRERLGHQDGGSTTEHVHFAGHHGDVMQDVGNDRQVHVTRTTGGIASTSTS